MNTSERSLKLFTNAYIESALWSSMDDDDVPLDRNYGVEDIALETLVRMQADCRAFVEANEDAIVAAIDSGQVRCGPDFEEYGHAGHDFWLTRNGHGAGFWDGDWPEPWADLLDKAAKAAGECDLYVGDDGRIYA